MKICCLKANVLPQKYVEKTVALRENIYKTIAAVPMEWIERSEAEIDTRYKQVIPYAVVVRADGRIATYPRHGTETRLHNLYSCGVGGHVDECDKRADLRQTVETGLERELGEELFNYDSTKVTLEYQGIINEVETETGMVHLGLVYSAKCAEGYEPFPAAELSGMEWRSVDELRGLKTELWSQMALDLIYFGGKNV